MARKYILDDKRSVQKRIDERSSTLFKEKDGQAGLQVTRIFKRRTTTAGAGDGKVRERNVFVRDLDVCDIAAVERLRDEHSNDTTQIYTIRQRRSWTTLDISHDLFQGFMSAHNVMLPFWKHMFAFGMKHTENEFEFPHFSRRVHRACPSKGQTTREFAYMIRRVELNRRTLEEYQNPWSIRQTAVYFQHVGSDSSVEPTNRSRFLLVAPSKNAESLLTEALNDSIKDDGIALSPWSVHRIFVADSLRGWMDYMTFLEKRLKDQSTRIVLASVGDEQDHLSPLTDFVINFEDRQDLKLVEDQVLDLQVILPGILNAIRGLQQELKHVTRFAEGEERDEAEDISEEFDEYIREVNMLVDRAKTLKSKSTSTARLLSDLLSYEEAVSLKKLSIETQLESKSMSHLAEKSTKDAAAVKVLTVITLVYLPFTIVANFFSTEFVQKNDDGHMTVARNVWLLAAIAIPFTLLTVGLWWTWVHFTEVKPTFNPLQPGVVVLQRSHSFRSMVSKTKKPAMDLESGMAIARSLTSKPPPSMNHSPVSTWSSQATTAKSEEC